VTLFELELIGGRWGRRLQARRAAVAGLRWDAIGEGATAGSLAAAREVWTQSAFSEYASAASFAQITAALLAAGAPLDLTASAADFVVDELFHAELSAKVAMALGGAVPLEVDLARLARPADSEGSLVRAAELVVRTSCVGEALTVPLLTLARRQSRVPAVRAVLARIVRDESQHALLGPWFLDWAGDRLSPGDRAHLGAVAGEAIGSFAPIFSAPCAPGAGLGVLGCQEYDAAFDEALARRVVRPLAARGIVVPPGDLARVRGRGGVIGGGP
jgi:hypothetical protein